VPATFIAYRIGLSVKKTGGGGRCPALYPVIKSLVDSSWLVGKFDKPFSAAAIVNRRHRGLSDACRINCLARRSASRIHTGSHSSKSSPTTVSPPAVEGPRRAAYGGPWDPLEGTHFAQMRLPRPTDRAATRLASGSRAAVGLTAAGVNRLRHIARVVRPMAASLGQTTWRSSAHLDRSQ
jgi:hypothetical protein